MDLLQTVRKEGSRGGRANFKWEDVKSDQHRENYLGHSLMAPVGRWQKHRDLSWYAKSSSLSAAEQQTAEEAARKEELRQIKEAEADALAAALGYPVAPRTKGPDTDANGNANMTELGQRDVKRVMQEASAADVDVGLGEGEKHGARGIGFGGYNGVVKREEEYGTDKVMNGSRGLGVRGGLVGRKDKSERRERKRSRSRTGGEDLGRAPEKDTTDETSAANASSRSPVHVQERQQTQPGDADLEIPKGEITGKITTAPGAIRGPGRDHPIERRGTAVVGIIGSSPG